MPVQTHSLSGKIIHRSQHPYNHTSDDIAYSNDVMPGVENLAAAFDWIMAVLYPNPQDSVDTTGDLPAVGNTLRDYRVVLDDGDGKAAGYQWQQREGDAVAKWYKIYDMDWGVGSVLSAFQDITQGMYVYKAGVDDTDEAGVAIAGTLAGQHVYGGASPNTNLTLFANSGDGVGPATGFVQSADSFRPVYNSQLSIGTTGLRWLKVWADEYQAGNLVIAPGSITDSDGLIDFGTTDLETLGYMRASEFGAFDDGDATVPTFYFVTDDETGLFLDSVGRIGFSSAGVASFFYDALGINIVVVGDEVNPSLSWNTGVGLYSDGTNVGLATNALKRVVVDSDGNIAFNDGASYYDASSNSWGIGTPTPGFPLHLYNTLQAQIVLETSSDDDPSALSFRRSRATDADIQNDDDLGFLDWYGKVDGLVHWMATIQSRYTGDGTTLQTDMIFATSNGSTPVERMRIRYDGNVGIGVINPTRTLDVSGTFAIDNLLMDGNTLASLDVDGHINFDPNGTGTVISHAAFVPSLTSVKDLGSSALKWADLYFDGSISDGSTSIQSSVIQSLRDINSGVAAGHTIFWDGDQWVSSAPDTEVDHGAISGLLDDDHTQYALLAGRGTGQVLMGGLASGNNLELWSTAHATQGSVIWKGILQPEGDNTRDVGTASFRVKDLYMAGQGIGFRVQNSTVGAVSASAGSIGRLLYDTTEQDVYVDRGGTWKKISIEKYVIQDAVGWDGVATSVVYTVSSEVSDARECIWVLKKNSDSFKQIGCDITMSQTQVTVSVDIPLAAGTYTLVGVG